MARIAAVNGRWDIEETGGYVAVWTTLVLTLPGAMGAWSTGSRLP
jgi:hypothetical protein